MHADFKQTNFVDTYGHACNNRVYERETILLKAMYVRSYFVEFLKVSQ